MEELLGLMNDRKKRVFLLINRDVLNEGFFGRRPCRNSSSIKSLTSELVDKR